MDKEKRIGEIAAAKAKYDQSIKNSAANLRLAALFDEGTFKATGAYIKAQPTAYEIKGNIDELENVITGYGLIDGRLVFAYSQDFSKLNGALGISGAEKILSLYELAAKNGAPVISVLDSSGAKIEEGTDALAAYGKILKKVASLSGIITQIAVICGPCTGAMALIAQSADYLIIEKNNGKLYLTPPSVVKHTCGKDSGSADDALVNGIAAKVCDSDDECMKYARTLMSYLPANNLEGPVYDCEVGDDINRTTAYIDSVTDVNGVSVNNVLADIADNGLYIEIGETFGKDIKCGFMTLAGSTVGFAACDISENGGFTSVDACMKTARHINYCDAFGIPFLTIVNSEGFAEVDNNAGAAAKLAAAFATASVPCITLELGKAYGTLFTALGSKSIGADLVFALEFSEISVMSPEKAVNFVWHDKIDGTNDPALARKQLCEEWCIKMASPIQAAYKGNVDDIISACEVRTALISGFEMLSSKSDIAPTKKHANLPL
ncbi:MAG: hypothetical protein E7588_01735 [Ruminococcaceae bacterium]|nr:hypothetical protein [Oscillospiraceae bacterium]